MTRMAYPHPVLIYQQLQILTRPLTDPWSPHRGPWVAALANARRIARLRQSSEPDMVTGTHFPTLPLDRHTPAEPKLSE